MESATSSWASPLALVAILSTAGVAAAQSGDGDAWQQARTLIAEGMYLESGLGDFAGAAELYRTGLAIDGLPAELEAELMFRLGEGSERLGDLEGASEAFQQLLDDHGSQEPWGGLAHGRILRLAEHSRRIFELPVAHDFAADTEGWLHTGGYQRQGQIEWTGDVGHSGGGALVWNSPVIGQDLDQVYLVFSTPSPWVAHVELWLRAVDFPAHLILLMVEEEGTRFASGRYVVEPGDGWIRIRSELDDFYLFPGEDVTRHPDPRRIEFLILQDATSTYSTDRGMNRILIDDVSVE
jgi:hypothetical protein